MRSSILLTSALAMGALARPQPHRRKGHVVTETDVVVTTLTVFVTEGYVEPTSTSLCISATASQEPTSNELPRASASPPNSTPTPEPAPEPAPAPIPTLEAAPQPKLEPTSFELVSSSAPTPTPSPEPQPEQEQEQEPASTESPLPLSSADPFPERLAPVSDHTSGKSQAYLSSGPEYQAAVLYHHNAARANHGARPLTWDTDCEANARIAAQRCTFAHYIPQGVRQGQNLFTVSGKAFNVTAGITESWYKSELEPMMPYFGQNDIPDDVFHSVGHLTQLVWKGTTKVGCVSIDCGSNMIVGGQTSSMNKYTVCNYAPAGNVGGRYAQNVAAPLSLSNLGGWAD